MLRIPMILPKQYVCFFINPMTFPIGVKLRIFVAAIVRAAVKHDAIPVDRCIARRIVVAVLKGQKLKGLLVPGLDCCATLVADEAHIMTAPLEIVVVAEVGRIEGYELLVPDFRALVC